jgi:hypothetical protein
MPAHGGAWGFRFQPPAGAERVYFAPHNKKEMRVSQLDDGAVASA